MNAPRFWTALAFIILALAAVLILYHYDDRPELAVTPACAPLTNPCATMRCIPKPETARMT